MPPAVYWEIHGSVSLTRDHFPLPYRPQYILIWLLPLQSAVALFLSAAVQHVTGSRVHGMCSCIAV